jgi:hypothetical protein
MIDRDILRERARTALGAGAYVTTTCFDGLWVARATDYYGEKALHVAAPSRAAAEGALAERLAAVQRGHMLGAEHLA